MDGPARSAVRDGDLRRHGRPDQAQAHPGDLQPDHQRAAARRVRHRRRRPFAADGRGIPAAHGEGPARARHRRDREGQAPVADRALELCRRRSRETGDVQGSGQGAGEARRGARNERQLSLLPRGAAQRLRRLREAARRRGSAARGGWELAARDHREAVRARPRVRARPEPSAPRGAAREPDLPHRSLPGQGDGAEHHGVPLRQRHLRADLEPPLRRSRADHRRRDGGRRGARRLLRGGGSAARHGAEPHVPAPRADRHGAADLVRGRRGARRAGEGAQGDPPPVARGRVARARCAGSMARACSTASACPRIAPSPRSRRNRTSRRSRRSSCSSTTGAGPTCRSICAPASGCRSGSRRSPSSSSARR